MIRWQRGDYIRLGKAVAEFNRQIAANMTLTNKQYLPETINYKELRDRIQTREGLNAYIEGLKRIKLPGAFNLERLEGGEIITKYQKGELERGISSATRALTKEVNMLEQEKKQSLGIDVDIKLPEAFKTPKQKELEALIRDYKKLYKLKGKDFRKRAAQLGINQTELNYRRAYVFRENYMKVMREHYSSYENYDLFKRWANQHKNPVNFYESLPEDRFSPDDLSYQSETYFSEDDFNAFLETLGINVEEETRRKEQLQANKQKQEK